MHGGPGFRNHCLAPLSRSAKKGREKILRAKKGHQVLCSSLPGGLVSIFFLVLFVHLYLLLQTADAFVCMRVCMAGSEPCAKP